MKINCGPTPEERRQAKYEKWKKKREWRESLKDWHPWFAWRPVRVGSRDCRWLEVVERRGSYEFNVYSDLFWLWEYREKAK